MTGGTPFFFARLQGAVGRMAGITERCCRQTRLAVSEGGEIVGVMTGTASQGDKLDSLDKLLGLDLPPLGPYSLAAQFAMKEQSYDFSDIRIKIGGSELTGHMNLNMLVRPKAKKPEFFSLATPVKVSGNFDDFGIGINLVRLTGTVVSFVTSPVHVPLRRIFARKRPEDGKEACWQAWDKRNLGE